MALASRSKLGPYEILSPLGRGRDRRGVSRAITRLDRTVAIDVLPPESRRIRTAGSGSSARLEPFLASTMSHLHAPRHRV